MSKVYSGDPGPPARAFVKSGKGKPKLLSSTTPVAWGDTGAAAGTLAFVILLDAIGDEQRATKLFGRFKHRAVADLKPGQPWTMTLESVLAVVADIERVELQTAQTRRMVELEPKPIAPGGLTQDMEWTSNPGITPNIPGRKS